MPSKHSVLLKRARPVRLIGMDVDGVLTGGEIIVLKSKEEVKVWNSKDRLLLSFLTKQKSPLIFAWITGRSSKGVSSAARNLRIHHVVQNCHDKKEAFDKILKKRRISYEQAAFIGDDLIDLSVLKKVGFAACPKDAVSDIRRNVHYVSSVKGGKGAVRDVLEFILKAQKKWNPILNSFLS